MERVPEDGRHRLIERRKEVVAYQNAYATVFDDEVTFADGSPGRHLRIAAVASGPGVVLLPVHKGAIGLVQTYRYPLGAWQWALPRGFSHATDPLETARAELWEELGLTSSSLRVIGRFSPDSGLLAEKVAVVLAKIHEVDGAPEDVLEVSGSRWPSIAALWGEIATGSVDDGMTLAALTLAHAAGAL
ncbi:NUDIX hydrolase [Kribbella qitaiheensis]|uniref:NUDIX hydrolase n=1 Tax=Kribbella qitaiheensis TaxID=1544730 RepID=A0A7G6X7T2_9ACTN|nr:NUDIX hydrolase [Kribbella qitaiheensis]QNE22297.1 NUDIX hydrolase [Kribbella qitaiheensis]